MVSEGFSFDSFLENFRDYVEDYFTKGIILVNELKVRSYDAGDIQLFVLDTPETDVWLKIFIPDLIIMDAHIAGRVNPNYLDHHWWNGTQLTIRQYEEFVRLFEQALEHYEKNKHKFASARKEAFMSLVVETKGEILKILKMGLGEENVAKLVAKELGLV